MYSQSSVAEATRATFGARLGGYIIDAVVLLVVNMITSLVFHNAALDLIVSLVVGIGYFVYFWSSTGQTLGDKVVGVKVVSTSGGLITPGGAFIRYLGIIVSSIPLFLGLLWVLWDPQRQGWHDKMASTYVVKA